MSKGTEIVKVEIAIIDEDWQWMGRLSRNKCALLCDIANKLADLEEEDVAE